MCYLDKVRFRVSRHLLQIFRPNWLLSDSRGKSDSDQEKSKEEESAEAQLKRASMRRRRKLEKHREIEVALEGLSCCLSPEYHPEKDLLYFLGENLYHYVNVFGSRCVEGVATAIESECCQAQSARRSQLLTFDSFHFHSHWLLPAQLWSLLKNEFVVLGWRSRHFPKCRLQSIVAATQKNQTGERLVTWKRDAE